LRCGICYFSDDESLKHNPVKKSSEDKFGVWTICSFRRPCSFISPAPWPMVYKGYPPLVTRVRLQAWHVHDDAGDAQGGNCGRSPLTSLRERLITIGAKMVSHGNHVTFQMAEVGDGTVAPQMLHEILMVIARLRAPPASA
jgi:hypothetical protein